MAQGEAPAPPRLKVTWPPALVNVVAAGPGVVISVGGAVGEATTSTLMEWLIAAAAAVADVGEDISWALFIAKTRSASDDSSMWLHPIHDFINHSDTPNCQATPSSRG